MVQESVCDWQVSPILLHIIFLGYFLTPSPLTPETQAAYFQSNLQLIPLQKANPTRSVLKD